ncbi:MAG TPA: sodium:proton antiporter [Halothiobacillus sp.]|nr:MAG: sodium:proton antiporter [Halothiobacillus sp. 20-54-6]HQT43325.1 sodium:proton antiporter [Halothiobacillus sp.]
MHESILLALTGIIVAGIAAQWLAWRAKVPAILFLLIIGVFLGPVTGWLQPDLLLGDLLFPFVSLAVAVILFEGSLTLQFAQLRGVGGFVWRLVSIGALVSWGVASAAAHYFVGLDWSMAALFGALVVVTGPTVIVPLLRIVRPTQKIATVLRWESIVIDPIGAVLAVLVFEFIVTRMSPAHAGTGLSVVISPFLTLISVGLALGLAGGYLLGIALRQHWLPEYLINVVVLATVLAVFTASNVAAEESGLLAVTVMGILLANMRGVPLADVLHFKESLTILFISGLFILLAARIHPAMFSAVGFGALLVLLAIQFIAQPLKVWLSAIGSGLNWREKLMIAWIGPRGIVAAAISGLFALKLDQQGVPGAEVLVPLTFIIIVGTVVSASLTARPLAMYLGVALPEDRGVLMVGINAFSRMLAQALKKQGYRVVLADANYADIRQARMEGLETFYGNPVSEAADRRLDLVGLGRLFAVSAQPEINNLAAIRYRHEFGAGNVFVLKTPQELTGSAQQRLSTTFSGRAMFGEQASLGDLLQLIEQGAEISTTRLTEAFGWVRYQETYAERGQLLLLISPRGIMHVMGSGHDPSPQEGWILLGLYRAAAPTEPEQAASAVDL